jgi:hypothetical protein
MSRLIGRTPCPNCISTVPTSELDLGVIAHILRTVLLTNRLSPAGALNEERLIDERRYGEMINRKLTQESYPNMIPIGSSNVKVVSHSVHGSPSLDPQPRIGPKL